MHTSEPIFKRDSVGNVRTWFYEVEGDKWRSNAGILDGTMVTSGWTVCTPKSMQTAELQAAFEAEAERRKKLEREYHPTVATIDEPNFFKPMLAQTYDTVTFPVFSQPKLDGIRCIATAKGLFSRQGKRFFAVPHIEEALAPLFDQYPDLILDGELYNHDLKDDFNQITSVVRKQKPTEEQIAKASELIQYHVYDVPSALGSFMSRYLHHLDLDAKLASSAIKAVTTHKVYDATELDRIYAGYIELGYEGQMVRLDVPYEQKRSKGLLKRKEFVSDEFPVVRVEEGLGNWAGYGKRIVCRLPDGREFGAGVKGNQAFTKELLTRDVKIATIKFFHLTPDGVPRFPVAVDFDRQD